MLTAVTDAFAQTFHDKYIFNLYSQIIFKKGGRGGQTIISILKVLQS